VCLHQSIIGQETIKQMEMAGEGPDVVIGCAGGGSNFAGLAFPFIQRKIKSGTNYRIIAAEPASCPSLTQGELRYDFGDTAQMTPLLMMHTLGHTFMPPSIHAGGLRYHGMSPMVSHCNKLGLIDAVAVPQLKVFKSAVEFARTEGIVPAPESAHAIAVAMDEAIRCREENRKQVIVFNLSGNGLLDLAAYDSYLSGKMQESGDDA
jgi:tryptophan synthase beta chain